MRPGKVHNSIRFTTESDKRKTRIFPKGIPLPDALGASGCIVEQPCGGQGRCGKCRVRFLRGAPNPTPEEDQLLGSDLLAEGWRLCCRHRLQQSAVVSVAPDTHERIWKEFGPAGPLTLQHPRFGISKLSLSSSSTLPEPLSWEERLLSLLRNDVGPLQFTYRGRCELANAIAQSVTPLTEVLIYDDHFVIGVGDFSSHPPLGLAVDFGTTTVAAAVVNLLNGEILGSEETINPQIQYGADVISRIGYASKSGENHLQEPLIRALDQLTKRLMNKLQMSTAQVYAVMCVGNSFMLHTLVGANPLCLGFAPYLPAWRSSFFGDAKGFGSQELAKAMFIIPPLLGGHVGADATAAIMATCLDEPGPPRLLMDLGTNCELALAFDKKLIVASAAAGPAFEGGNVHCGMRATAGALDRAALDARGDLWIHTIGDVPPRGICGAGLFDLVALLLDCGIVAPDGRIRSRKELSAVAVSRAMMQRVFSLDTGEPAFRISPLYSKQTLYLAASDVRQLQLAKAAIRAAIEILLEEAGLKTDQLQTIYVTGQFGTYVKKSALMRLGLLPPVKPGKVHIIPNAAGWGARLIMLDHELWKRTLSVACRVEHLDLACHSRYAEIFAEAMSF